MRKIYLSAFLLLLSLAVNAQCLTATKGQFPATTFTAACTGTPATITSQGYAGEYSKVSVISGTTYIFSSSISTDFITVSDSAGSTAYTSGTTPVTWTATSSRIIRFYTHTNSTCGEAPVLRSRFIQCTNACTFPAAQPTGLTLIPSANTINGSFTTPSPAPANYLVVRYASGGGNTPALPVNTVEYTAGNTITATGLSTGTVVYAGPSTTFTATGLTFTSTYDFIVFAYNNSTSCSSCSATYNVMATTGQNRGSATTSCSTIPPIITVGATGDYPTLTTVSTLFGECPITAPVTIQLLRDYSTTGETFPITINAIKGASITNTVTIRPAPSAIVAITGNQRLVLKILSSYVTIDGSNNGTTSRDLTISNTSSAGNQFTLVIGSTGTAPIKNVTVKNVIINNGSGVGGAAFVVSDGATIGNKGYFNDISILNNNVQKANYGIACLAADATGNGSGLNISGNDLSTVGTDAIGYSGIYLLGVDGATVAGNTLGNFTLLYDCKAILFGPGTINSSILGNKISNLGITSNSSGTPVDGVAAIFVNTDTAGSNILVSGNTITSINGSNTVGSTPSGIYISGNTSGVTIEKNKISNLKNNFAGTGAYGIRLAGTATTGTITVANNFIYDIAGTGSATAANNGHGIAVISGTGYNIYYNSVNLNTNQTATAGLPAALYVASGVTASASVNVRNNIFANSQTLGTNRYVIYSDAANTVFSAIDYNDYYTAGPNLGFIGSNRNNLAALRTGFGGNANSKNILPVFTSATDLHLPAATNTTLANLATPISGFTTDIDNQTRSVTAPDMGADEFDVALPVKLLSFDGERKGNTSLLTWSTVTEINNSGFELQRSANGVDFSKTAFEASNALNGNSNSLLQYGFTDTNPLSGPNYYRLKQIDKDGNFSYSRIIYITVPKTEYLIFSNLYPNPVNKTVTATVGTPESTEATFVVTDIEGKTVMSKSIGLSAGDNQVGLDVSRLSSGTYFIKIVCVNGWESKGWKFVKE